MMPGGVGSNCWALKSPSTGRSRVPGKGSKAKTPLWGKRGFLFEAGRWGSQRFNVVSRFRLKGSKRLLHFTTQAKSGFQPVDRIGQLLGAEHADQPIERRRGVPPISSEFQIFLNDLRGIVVSAKGWAFSARQVNRHRREKAGSG